MGPLPAIAQSLKDTPAPPPTAWDIAFGSAIASDYVFRGISLSNRQPMASAYSELRYNWASNVQIYGAVSTNSIEFPNRAAAETDFYGGIRSTFGKLALNVNAGYYDFPGGRLYDGSTSASTAFGAPGLNCTNGFYAAHGSCNTELAALGFAEVSTGGTYAFNDTIAAGANIFYAPSWGNTDADGTYVSGTLKLTAPSNMLPSKDDRAYFSGEFGHYFFGRTGAFSGNTVFPGQADGILLPEYNTWNAGLTFTCKVFTFDLRYYDTDLSKGNCNVLTGDNTAAYSARNISPINPSGLGSGWCGSTVVAKLSFDMTGSSGLK